ncbi:hypothetical protein HD597_004228 [Nonomuraea thailandensis]|uniref:Uncharacterized protein n=1 Tax=Nonomuraea thailandensis TaxID=1188745 RepID=A0A9X2GMV3_9ACTN|nr:hypothetical protein [Nonomuraea thailandensis]
MVLVERASRQERRVTVGAWRGCACGQDPHTPGVVE